MTVLPPSEDEVRPAVHPGFRAGLPSALRRTGPDADQWLLQADAAEHAGCSVSAIRKWRREGSVTSRKITTPSGSERVEVRVADVLRRAGRGPRQAEVADGTPVALGAVLVPVEEFRALSARVIGAEQRVAALESRLRSVDAEASHLRLRLAELSRRIEGQRTPAPARTGLREPNGAGAPAPAAAPRLQPAPQPPAPRPPAPQRAAAPALAPRRPAPQPPAAEPAPAAPRSLPPARPPVDEKGRLPVRPSPRREYDARPPRPVPTPTFQQWLGDGPTETPRRTPPVDPARLLERLRTLYGRLQEWQSREVASPGEAEGWLADLAAYDGSLVRACRALGVETPYRPGQRLPAEVRVTLTRELAARGADITAEPTPA